MEPHGVLSDGSVFVFCYLLGWLNLNKKKAVSKTRSIESRS